MAKDELGIGMIIMVFVAIVVGLVIYSGGIAPAVGDSTLTKTVPITTQISGVAGSTVTLTGKAATSFHAYNGTTGDEIPASNYTVTNYKVLTDGTIGSQVTWKTGTLLGASTNVTYTYEPLGYASDSGTRAVINLIAIFSVLAIAMIALWPTIGSRVLEQFS